MTNTERFNKSVGILATAYLQGTLQQDECAACAVGNLVAGYCNYKVISVRDSPLGYKLGYELVFVTATGKELVPAWQFADPDYCSMKDYQQSGMSQVASTGYSFSELKAIEGCFENWPVAVWHHLPGFTYPQVAETQDAEFDGLMRVVECLAFIHKVHLETKQAAKELFANA